MSNAYGKIIANVEQLHRLMDEEGISAIVARSGKNFTYLAGFAYPGMTVSCQVRPMRSMAATTRVSPPARRLSRRRHPRRSWVPVEPETPMSRNRRLVRMYP